MDSEDRQRLKWILGIGGPIFSTSASEIGDGDPLAGTCILAIFLGGTWSSETSEAPPDFTIRGWFRDSIPYTHVEKRATKSFNNLHPNSKISNKQPFITSDNKDTYAAVSVLFGNKSREQILEDLEVLERVLTYEKEHHSNTERLLEKF